MPSDDLRLAFENAADGFDFFEALRLIECWHPDKPRIGSSVKAGDDALRFTQIPELGFQPSSIAAFLADEQGSGHGRLAVNFMGLFGPHGSLPLHLTEYARERIRHHHDPTFAGFADIFHHRMISLFYRAWASSRPTVQYDRPESDRYSFYVGTLSGIGGEAFRNRDALADRAKLFYAGHFSGQTKHPDGLRCIIADILRISVSIEEFVGEWMAIQLSDQTRLGWLTELATLGQSALLGACVWGCQHKFRVKLGPMKLFQYLALLPGGTGLRQLVAIVRNYVGDEYVWDAQLILEKSEVPLELALGQPPAGKQTSMNGDAQLGWSMWLGPHKRERDADDLLLDPFIRVGINGF